jgi:transposase InsO family protein
MTDNDFNETYEVVPIGRAAISHSGSRHLVWSSLLAADPCNGIRDHAIAPRSPWQNACVERLIGSIRRECLDHMIVFGEAHLRRILRGYAGRPPCGRDFQRQ